MALKDIVLKLIIDGKESLVTLDKLDNKMQGIGKGAKNIAGAMGLAFGSYQVIGFIIDFVKDSIALVQRENEVIGKLNATLKSTDYAAGLMSDELIDLANNLEELTNYKFDDKDIIDAEGLLLTFKRINKEVFPEAMRLALDLSVRFDQDLTSSVKQLGKALDDPEKGLTALRKAGVLFTDAQQEQIKALIKNNDLLGAQRMILSELSTQVSGSAAASVDEYTLKVNQLNEALEAVQLTLGQIITYSATGMLDFLAALMDNNGNVQAAMISMQMQQRMAKTKGTTTGDLLNEARNSASKQIEGKSDDEIRKLIANNKAMTRASFEGFDSYGNIIDTQGTIQMLNAKLAVYETALLKADDKVKDKKKENVYDLAAYQKDLEEIHYKDLMEQDDELNQARRDALNDIEMYDPIKILSKEAGSGGTLQKMNFQLSATAMAIQSIKQGYDDMGNSAVSAGMKSIYIFKKENSVLQIMINSLIKSLYQTLALKGIAGLGGLIFGGGAGAAVAMQAVPMASGGVVTKPTMSLIGEAGPEAVIPLNRFNGNGFNSDTIERKLDQVINAFVNKQFEFDYDSFKTANKKLDYRESYRV